MINIKAMRVYTGMLERCYNPNNHAYKNYGGRGIYIEREWLDDPTEFLKWYLKRNFEDGQVDRIDVNGPYSSKNCRIVSPKENSRNRRNTRFLEAFGELKSYGAWAEDIRAGTGLTINSIVARVESGWNPERAITTAVSVIKGQHPDTPKLIAFGESKTLHEWSIDPRCKVDKNTLWYRKSKGWEMEKAIITPPAKNAGQLYEGKSVLQWSKDPQCEVSYKVLNTRLKKGIQLDTALKS